MNFKSHIVVGLEPARATTHAMRRPATRGRPKSRMGLGLAPRSSEGNDLQRGHLTQSTHAMARWRARWLLAGGKMLPVSTEEALGRCRAWSRETALTEKGSPILLFGSV
jgi:hypothetical protein